MDKRVLIIGSDGLRPDSVNPADMPTYSRLLGEGTQFTKFCAAYPSETRVSMTTLTTGVYPGKHGVVLNRPYMPKFRDGWVQTGDPSHLLHYKQAAGESLVLRPTLGDRLHASGAEFSVTSTGSGGSALLWNLLHPEKIINTTTTFGASFNEQIRNEIGEAPVGIPDKERWALKAFLKYQLPDTRNRAMVFWVANPDTACHKFGLGSPQHHEALGNIDGYLAEILHAIAQRGEEINILFVSDHGHSTVDPQGEFSRLVENACPELGLDFHNLAISGCAVYDKTLLSGPELKRLAHWLKAQPWCGSVFVNAPEAAAYGALPMDVLYGYFEHERIPRLVYNPLWSDAKNSRGVPGIIQLAVESGLSTHGNANPTELNSFCLGWGSAFRKGHVVDTPCGLVDIAPTVLNLLGLDMDHEGEFDGRVLSEGFISGGKHPRAVYSTKGEGTQRQPLEIAHVANTYYILGCKN